MGVFEMQPLNTVPAFNARPDLGLALANADIQPADPNAATVAAPETAATPYRDAAKRFGNFMLQNKDWMSTIAPVLANFGNRDLFQRSVQNAATKMTSGAAVGNATKSIVAPTDANMGIGATRHPVETKITTHHKYSDTPGLMAPERFVPRSDLNLTPAPAASSPNGMTYAPPGTVPFPSSSTEQVEPVLQTGTVPPVASTLSEGIRMPTAPIAAAPGRPALPDSFVRDLTLMAQNEGVPATMEWASKLLKAVPEMETARAAATTARYHEALLPYQQAHYMGQLQQETATAALRYAEVREHTPEGKAAMAYAEASGKGLGEQAANEVAAKNLTDVPISAELVANIPGIKTLGKDMAGVVRNIGMKGLLSLLESSAHVKSSQTIAGGMTGAASITANAQKAAVASVQAGLKEGIENTRKMIEDFDKTYRDTSGMTPDQVTAAKQMAAIGKQRIATPEDLRYRRSLQSDLLAKQEVADAYNRSIAASANVPVPGTRAPATPTTSPVTDRRRSTAPKNVVDQVLKQYPNAVGIRLEKGKVVFEVGKNTYRQK